VLAMSIVNGKTGEFDRVFQDLLYFCMRYTNIILTG
jgi:hypothetical protein